MSRLLPMGGRLSPPVRLQAAIAALGLGLTALLVIVDLRVERERERRTFERNAESRVIEISRAHDERIRNDEVIADLFETPGSLSEERFVKFAKSHPPAFRRAIEFVPRVRGPERPRFEAELSVAHPGASGIWEPGPDGDHRSAGSRSDYFPVRFMHPTGDMEGVFGFDLASEPARRAALELAARSGHSTLSEPVRLVEDPSRWAYLRYVPLYDQGLPEGTPDERWKALRGFVVAVYRFGDTLDAAMEQAGMARQVVYLYATDRHDALPVHVFRTRDAATRHPSAPTLSEARALPGAYASLFHLSDRELVYVFLPWPSTPAWRLLSASGAIIALLGFALTAAVVIDRRRSRHAIEAAAAGEERTMQILDAVPEAILIADETGLIVRTNARTCEIFGYREGELTGHPFETLAGEKASGRNPRRLVFPRLAAPGADSPRTVELSGYRKDGTELPIEVDLRPVQFEGRSYVLASIRDVTDRRR
jgi:PAS domain S-box-containing protein